MSVFRLQIRFPDFRAQKLRSQVWASGVAKKSSPLASQVALNNWIVNYDSLIANIVAL